MGLVTFLRRVPPALRWRIAYRSEPIVRSSLRRSAAAGSVRAKRALTRQHGRASARRPIVLRFANAHATRLRELEWFAEDVAQESGGAIAIKFVDRWTTSNNVQEETATVFDISKDRADLCWAGTRAFGCLGVRSLDPLQAPLLLADYPAVAAACRDEVAQAMLEPLGRLDLAGIVVLPGALRKPFAFTRRLLGPRDYEGTKLRIHESVVAEATYHCLGAEAVVLSPRQMSRNPEARVDGLDIQIEAMPAWRLSGSVTYNVNLWPRTIAIVGSRKTYAWLGAAERELLHAAARRTLDRALKHLDDQEQRDHDAMPTDVNPIIATDEQVAAIRERVEPVYEGLRSHPDTSAYMPRVEAIAARSVGSRSG